MPERGTSAWPLAVAGLLAAMVASSLAFYAVARLHPDPLVVDDAWRAGRGYSEAVRAARRGAEIGWRLELAAAPSPGGVAVQVAVVDREAAPVAPERVEVRRVRPAEGGLDERFALGRAGSGFAGRVPLPRPGRWHLVVRAERGAEAVERTFAVWAP